MNATLYGLIAYIARYWFIALMIVIIWRAIHWLKYDADRKAIVKSMLPDAGFIGEWAVLYGGDLLRNDAPISATRDGWIGSARACDVRVHAKGIPKRAARFYLKRDGLHLLPQKSGFIEVDGAPVLQEAVLRHGATMTLGGITLQLRLFAGILLEGEIPVSLLEPPASPAVSRIETGTMDDTDDIDYVRLPQPSLTVPVRRNRGRKSGQKKPNA